MYKDKLVKQPEPILQTMVGILIETEKKTQLKKFRAEVAALIDNHPIVRANAYTGRFSQGKATMAELRHLTIQFSVFSHMFIEAQLRKCINAVDLESYRAGKEILMNELGVSFAKNGSVEGGQFRFTAGHFEWLNDFAAHLGLQFDQIGKRCHGTESTLAFCDALMEWYGSDNPSIAAGASYGIEHWAAAGFWKELICGLKKIKATELPDLPLGFWTWHDQLEDQHAMHTNDELSQVFFRADFSKDAFLSGGAAMLDAVAVFWNGLVADRIENRVG